MHAPCTASFATLIPTNLAVQGACSAPQHLMESTLKTTGMLGGLSWESTQIYYRIVNETVRETLGGLHAMGV